MDETKPVLCSRCHISIEAWIDADGQMLTASCGNRYHSRTPEGRQSAISPTSSSGKCSGSVCP
jgi:hypothetical protein